MERTISLNMNNFKFTSKDINFVDEYLFKLHAANAQKYNTDVRRYMADCAMHNDVTVRYVAESKQSEVVLSCFENMLLSFEGVEVLMFNIDLWRGIPLDAISATPEQRSTRLSQFDDAIDKLHSVTNGKFRFVTHTLRPIVVNLFAQADALKTTHTDEATVFAFQFNNAEGRPATMIKLNLQRF